VDGKSLHLVYVGIRDIQELGVDDNHVIRAAAGFRRRRNGSVGKEGAIGAEIGYLDRSIQVIGTRRRWSSSHANARPADVAPGRNCSAASATAGGNDGGWAGMGSAPGQQQ